MREDCNALTLAHRFVTERVPQGGFCIDATAGRGRDTAFLCRLVGDRGQVLAFDVQEEAVASARRLLEEQSLDHIGRVELDSHEHMGNYASPGTVDCIMFNLGWLPGGDHGIFTRAQSSIAAIRAGLELLKVGGLMTVCIYYGRDCGFEERDALLEFFPTLDSGRFTALVAQFANRPNNPPIPVFITRDR